VVTLRQADPVADRPDAHEILRSYYRAGGPFYAVHPGDLDWWTFHVDPESTPRTLYLGDGVLAHLDRARREGYLLGPMDELVPWCEDELGPGRVEVGFVSVRDSATESYLRERGYALVEGEVMVVLTISLEGVLPERPAPEGFTVRPLTGLTEADSRADAARSAFRTSMEPAAHRTRYRRFMASPAYDPDHDVVAVTPGGAVASFAVWWRDDALSLGQFEPVGTHESYQGLGLGAAVLAACLAGMQSAGLRTARVYTDESRPPAIALYRSMGFEIVDTLRWWERP
jgi:ribosomal protein S18 acetylase RimI-like enzyme